MAEERHREWVFITSHFLVLLCLADDPEVRLAEVATRLEITERRVQAILADLLEAGYVARERRGRRNHYTVHRDVPLRHPETRHRTIGDLLDFMADTVD